MSCDQLDYHNGSHNVLMTLWIPQGVTLYLQGTLQLKPWLLFQEGMFLYKPLQIILCWKTQGQTLVCRQSLPTIAILTQARWLKRKLVLVWWMKICLLSLHRLWLEELVSSRNCAAVKVYQCIADYTNWSHLFLTV